VSASIKLAELVGPPAQAHGDTSTASRTNLALLAGQMPRVSREWLHGDVLRSLWCCWVGLFRGRQGGQQGDKYLARARCLGPDGGRC